MNAFTDQSSQSLTFQPASGVRRSCRNCDYIAVTPDIKCPRCGKIPLVAVGKLKIKGTLKIVWGILPVVILSAIFLTGYNRSLQNDFSVVGKIFRVDTLSFCLFCWGILLTFGGSFCEVAAGIWLIVYAKPNRTIQTLKPILRVLYVVTGLAFVIVNKIGGYD